MFEVRAVLLAVASYLKENPDEIVAALRNVALLKIGVPVSGLRWLSSNAKLGKKGPRDIEIDASPPALRLAASVEAMGTPVRVSAAIRVDDVRVQADQVLVTLCVRDLDLKLQGESETPVAMLIKSGALDLSKPGNFIKYLPKKPPFLIEADGDRIVLDLLKVPKLAKNPVLRRALAVVTPVVGVRAIETEDRKLFVAFRATPAGLRDSLRALRRK